MMKEVGPGADARSGCGKLEKGVASQTAGGVPGEEGLGSLQMAAQPKGQWRSRSWITCVNHWLTTAGYGEDCTGHLTAAHRAHGDQLSRVSATARSNDCPPLQQGVPGRCAGGWGELQRAQPGEWPRKLQGAGSILGRKHAR